MPALWQNFQAIHSHDQCFLAGDDPIGHACHYLQEPSRPKLVLQAGYDNHRHARQSHVSKGPIHSSYSRLLTYSSPKQRVVAVQFHKIISVDTTILRCPKQYILGVNQQHHIRPVIAIKCTIKKNTCLLCDRAQYNSPIGRSDGVVPTVCNSTVAPLLKKS